MAKAASFIDFIVRSFRYGVKRCARNAAVVFGLAKTKLTCRGRCKSLVSRETCDAAPVRCHAWLAARKRFGKVYCLVFFDTLGITIRHKIQSHVMLKERLEPREHQRKPLS